MLLTAREGERLAGGGLAADAPRPGSPLHRLLQLGWYDVEQQGLQRGHTPEYSARADLEWKIVYVGSAESEKHDQVLDCVMVGPVVAGKFKFVFQARCDPSGIPCACWGGRR